MKWLIKNPAPSDSRRRKWGDFHFGRCLTKYLVRMGHEVVTHYDPGWDERTDADVILVLRGKYRFDPDRDRDGDALRVMWNISHPTEVTVEEYDTYDLVCVASRTRAEQLQGRVAAPLHVLLQCTDTEEFTADPLAGPPGRGRSGVVFVGNTRDVERPGVHWALAYGLPLRIWGRGWAQVGVPADVVEADYIDNEQLGALYHRSRVTLNDHYEDMKTAGFVNNRVFDALACGLPVISDWHAELEALFPDGVLLYRDEDEFAACAETVLLEYPTLARRAADAGNAVRAEHSFERRARQLIDVATAAR